jgi:hypothetical protein
MATNNLKIILKEQGRNQKWLRKRMREENVERDPSTISRWVKNKHTIRDTFVIDVICKILSITKEELLNSEEMTEFKSI